MIGASDAKFHEATDGVEAQLEKARDAAKSVRITLSPPACCRELGGVRARSHKMGCARGRRPSINSAGDGTPEGTDGSPKRPCG